MAANDAAATLSWKTPFSTPIRKDNSTCRDLFQNSEKLLASAVSICRLKGSVECQTGGLITVCEELQSLIRLAFSEISRLEKDLKTQRSQYEDEVSCLKERVKHLEERHTQKPMYMENGGVKDVSRTVNGVDNESEPGDLQEVEVSNALPVELHEDGNSNNSDPCLVSVNITPSQKIPPIPVTQEQKPGSPQKSKRSDTKKSWKQLSTKKGVKPPDFTENTKDNFNNQDDSRSELPFHSHGEFSQDVPITKVHYKDDKEELQKKTKGKGVNGTKPSRNSPQRIFTDDVLQRKEKGKKNGRRKLIVEKSDNQGETICCVEVKEKIKNKNENSTVHKKSQRGSWQKPLQDQKSESDISDQNTLEDPENEERKEGFEPLGSFQNGQPRDTATFNETEVLNKNSAAKQNDNEPLGDLSFLIYVNSQISTFVSDPSQQECELQPMTARERNDVYKLTHLYKVRARIGSKTENSLTTVRLSKQHDTQMPKPGRVDCLLSELSFSTSKEAEKESFKGKMKRRISTSVKGNEEGTALDDLEQDAPPKKKLSRLSRGKKV